MCEVLSTGPPPSVGDPLVVQVSRWDRLKDHMGVMLGFAEHVVHPDAHLILAGPNVTSVTDDPEGAEVLEEAAAAWRGLPHVRRSRIHLACLPMADIEENAAIVNALQRHATVVVQKSIAEGFGLTVAEAMWKARPVVASAVGGIQDQIEDGVTGLLLEDPADLEGFGKLVTRLLEDPAFATELGSHAREEVRAHFLANRHAHAVRAAVCQHHRGPRRRGRAGELGVSRQPARAGAPPWPAAPRASAPPRGRARSRRAPSCGPHRCRRSRVRRPS